MKPNSRLLPFSLLALFCVILLVAAQPKFPTTNLRPDVSSQTADRSAGLPRRQPSLPDLVDPHDLKVAPASVPNEAEKDPEPESSRRLRGRVMSDHGAALAGVEVMLTAPIEASIRRADQLLGLGEKPSSTALQSVSTNPRGEYELLCPPEAGHYFVIARTEQSRVSLLVPALGDQLPPLILATPRFVKGLVVDEHDRPVAAAKVVVIPEPQSSDPNELLALDQLSETLRADDFGRFEVSLSTAYNYALGATMADGAFNLVALAQGWADEVVIRIVGTMTLKGQVVSREEPDGVGAARILATAIGPQGMTTASTTTDGQGRFEISGLSSLTGLSLRVQAAGYAAFASLSSPSGLVFDDEQAAEARVTVTLNRGQVVSGFLRNPRNEALRGVVLRFTELGSGQTRDCRTEPDGRFRCSGLATGQHGLSLPFSTEVLAESSRYLTLHSAAMELELRTVPTGTLVGRVLKASGEGLTQASVALCFLESADRFIATTDSTGDFELKNLPLGPAELKLSFPGLATKCLQIDVLERLALEPVVLQRGATLRGELRGPRGLACANAQITVLQGDQQVFRRSSSAEDGRFSLADLPAEELRLVIRWGNSPCHCLDLGALNPGEVKDLGQIDLEAGRELQVLVRNQDGEAQEGIIVTCRLLSGYGREDTRIFETDAEGLVSLSGASKGTALFVMAADREFGVAKLVIGPDQEGLCELQLAKP